MSIRGIGVDMVEVARFRALRGGRRNALIRKLFTAREATYCFQRRDSAPHAAGIFAAKEAVFKSLSRPGLSLPEIEVRHAQNGAPKVFVQGRRARRVIVSVTHTAFLALALAVRT